MVYIHVYIFLIFSFIFFKNYISTSQVKVATIESTINQLDKDEIVVVSTL